MGSSVEILINEKTFDEIRFDGTTCFHENDVCYPEECRCSYDGRKLSLNITASLGMTNQTFGCKGRFVVNGTIYNARTIMKLKGKGKKNHLYRISFAIKSEKKRNIDSFMFVNNRHDNLIDFDYILAKEKETTWFQKLNTLLDK